MKISKLFAIFMFGLLINACDKAGSTPNYLVILTKSGDNQEASFISIKDNDECESRANRARQVFPSADIEYIDHFCLYSKYRFSPFGHGMAEKPNNYYGLNISKDRKKLTGLKSYASVDKCKNDNSKLCVISAHKIITD